jgi:hypothetical protein
VAADDAQAIFNSAVMDVRAWIASNYEPIKKRYVDAVRNGESDADLTIIAAEAAGAADELENKFVALLHIPELPDWFGGGASLINEYAGNWAATSDLWMDLEEAHSARG